MMRIAQIGCLLPIGLPLGLLAQEASSGFDFRGTVSAGAF